MPESSSKRPSFKKIFVIASGLAFLGTMTLPMLSMLNEPAPGNAPTDQAGKTASPEQQLKEIETGYEKVLEREPDNVTALQGLAQARLKRGDLKGGVVPLKKLAKMFPEQKELATLVTQIETQLKNSKAVPPNVPPSNTPPSNVPSDNVPPSNVPPQSP